MKKIVAVFLVMTFALTVFTGCAAGVTGTTNAAPAGKSGAAAETGSREAGTEPGAAAVLDEKEPKRAEEDEVLGPEQGARLVAICQAYARENFSEEEMVSIQNWDAPEIAETGVPVPETYWVVNSAVAESAAGCYEITFCTTVDDMLGPMVFYLNEDGEVFGLGYRE